MSIWLWMSLQASVRFFKCLTLFKEPKTNWTISSILTQAQLQLLVIPTYSLFRASSRRCWRRWNTSWRVAWTWNWISRLARYTLKRACSIGSRCSMKNLCQTVIRSRQRAELWSTLREGKICRSRHQLSQLIAGPDLWPRLTREVFIWQTRIHKNVIWNTRAFGMLATV